MYDFLLEQYLIGKIDDVKLIFAVTKGWISEQQKNEIISKKIT